MQTAYQSDEDEDEVTIPSEDPTAYEEEAEDDIEAESGAKYSNADVRQRVRSAAERSWWWQQLGPRTRQATRVDYRENKSVPVEPKLPAQRRATKVCQL